MNLIKPYFSIFPGIKLHGLSKHVEMCGRTCYKSHDKVTEYSDTSFIKQVITSGHESVLEHSVIVLKITLWRFIFWKLFLPTKFFNFTLSNIARPIVSGNIRAFRDMFKREVSQSVRWVTRLMVFLSSFLAIKVFFEDVVFFNLKVKKKTGALKYVVLLDEKDLKTQEEKAKHIVKTVKIVADRGFLAEIRTHRKDVGFSVESTRYCNYSKSKFGGQLTFIVPLWVGVPLGEYVYIDASNAVRRRVNSNFEYFSREDVGCDAPFMWLKAMARVEFVYLTLLEDGWQAQQARSVLPMSLKTEMIMTATLEEYKYIFSLRDDKAAHPQMQEIMAPMHVEFKKMFPEVFA